MDKACGFCRFYQSNRFFSTEEEHISHMAFCVCTDSPIATNIVQKSHILCNVNNFGIVHNLDEYILLN